MAFEKGQSGNPGGRPKGSGAFAAYAREKVKDGSALVNFWLEVMDDPEVDWPHRLRASQLLAERGFGKPAQPVTGEDGGPVQLEVSDPRERLAGRVDELAERRRARTATG